MHIFFRLVHTRNNCEPLSFSHQDSSDSNHPGDVLDHETFNEDFDNEMTLDQFMHHVESLGQHGTICDFHEFGLIFAGQMHCLPQRLKSTLHSSTTI